VLVAEVPTPLITERKARHPLEWKDTGSERAGQKLNRRRID